MSPYAIWLDYYHINLTPIDAGIEIPRQLSGDALDYTLDEKPSPDEVAQRHQIIRSIAKEFEDREIDYSVRGTVGTPAKSILKVASETDTNLLCIGGEERSPAGKAIFGNTAQKILLNAPCPVVFVREETFESK